MTTTETRCDCGQPGCYLIRVQRPEWICTDCLNTLADGHEWPVAA